MTFGDIAVAIGDIIQSSFVLLEAGQNYVNYTFLIGGFVGLFVWLRMQSNFNKEAERTGGLK